MLTGASAVAVEAMLMDVPVVTMDFCNEIHGVDFIDAGATIHVNTAGIARRGRERNPRHADLGLKSCRARAPTWKMHSVRSMEARPAAVRSRCSR